MITWVNVEKHNRRYILIREFEDYGWVDEAQPGDLVRRELFEDDRGVKRIPLGIVVSRVGDEIAVFWTGDTRW